MDVRACMTTNPEACLPTDSCTAAGEIMLRRNCGFVPIVSDFVAQRVIGVVTDRDLLVHLVEANEAPWALPVAACMTSPAKTIQADADIADAMALMESAAIQRLPVLEGGRLVGVLSLKDLVLVARREWPLVGPHRMEQQVTEIVEAIAAAR